ncbi:MAG: T9SS type A sorting domain-containing protein, partial [Flavobacteriales bacterium]|nr:T9SS type A sorting domain-containing protein [Flavobacteriales bacterium]
PQVPAPCGSVSGTVFNDADQDCTNDAGEYGLPFRVLTIDPGPSYAITDQLGAYYSAATFGSFTLAQPLVDESQLCPPDVPAAFTIDAGSPDVTLDLADSSFAPLDTRVSLWASPARPGFPASVHGTFWNASAYPSGEVTLVVHYDPMLDPVTVSPTPTGLTPGTAEWSLSGLDAFEYMHFQLQGTVPADIGLLGTVISFLATASDGVQELDMVNNAAAQNVTITGSVDPNDKIARTSAGHSSTQYFIDEDMYIDYTVRFQNTGTDTAFTVVVRDSLEAELDPASLEILGASHAFVPSFENGRTLVFTFNEINLPDSGTNYAASNGSVHFRLKPRADIAVGEMIRNSAGIWFDFNEPVITDPSELLVEMSTSVAEKKDGELVLWPNPSEDLLRVSINDPGHRLFQLDVLAVDGRVVLRDGAFLLSEALETRPLQRGAYLLRLQDTDGRVHQAPFVKR